MAYEVNTGEDFTFPQGADLSAAAGKCVKLNTSGQAVLCDTTAAEAFIGVTTDNSSAATTGLQVPVRTGGIVKVLAGGTFNPGVTLAANASGLAVLYTKATVFTGTPYIVSGSSVIGVSLDAGVNGQVATMLVSPRGLHN